MKEWKKDRIWERNKESNNIVFLERALPRAMKNNP